VLSNKKVAISNKIVASSKNNRPDAINLSF